MANIITGTTLDDVLPGTPQDDQITGLAGNDTITGLAGNDLIYGNQGNDTIDGGPGDDTIFGGFGNDSIGSLGSPSSSGTYIVYGESGADTIAGGGGDDTIYGGQGPDLIIMEGSGGSDLIYGNQGNDTLLGFVGADTIYGGQDNDAISGEAGNDIIYGNSGNDVLVGGGPADLGNDTVYGGQGNDILRSQANDQDLLFGNHGADTFEFSFLDQSTTGGIVADATSDRVADFRTGVDMVGLDRSDFTGGGDVDYFEQLSPNVTTVEQAIAAVGDATGKDVIFVAGTNDGFLLINANGDNAISGTNEFAVVLQGKNSLADFAFTDVGFISFDPG